MKKLKEALKLIIFRPKLIIDFDYDKYWRNKRGSKMQNLTKFQRYRADLAIKMIESEGKTPMRLLRRIAIVLPMQQPRRSTRLGQ